MSSQSIFNCCKVFPTLSKETQGIYSSAFRTKPIKIKKPTSHNSPKASLKTLSTVRSHKNLQNALKSSQIHLESTTEGPKQISIHKLIAFEPTPFEQFKAPKPTRKLYQSPIIYKPLVRVTSLPIIQKQKFNLPFTYQPNPQIRWTAIPQSIKNPEDTNSSSKAQEHKNIEQYHPQSKPQTKRHKQIKINIEEPKHKNQHKKHVVALIPKKLTKRNLGDSKFTVMSKQVGELQAEKPVNKLDQSSIILNFFNPTTSQLFKIQDINGE